MVEVGRQTMEEIWTLQPFNGGVPWRLYVHAGVVIMGGYRGIPGRLQFPSGFADLKTDRVHAML